MKKLLCFLFGHNWGITEWRESNGRILDAKSECTSCGSFASEGLAYEHAIRAKQSIEFKEAV